MQHTTTQQSMHPTIDNTATRAIMILTVLLCAMLLIGMFKQLGHTAKH